jgi:hypothetical protein
VSACSGDEPGDGAASAPTSTSAATSPSGSAAPQSGSEFCTRSRALIEGLGAAFSEQADAAAVQEAFEQAADGFRAIEPPAEVEDDWTTLAEGLDEYAAAVADLDESDPDSVAAFQERTGTLQGELTGAATGVESYLAAECGPPDLGPPTSAAPSS